MVRVKVNNSRIFSDRFIAASILGWSVSTVFSLALAAYAGPQSLLDPYASVQPPLGQTDAPSSGEHIHTKKTHSSSKHKVAKSATKTAPKQVSSTAHSAPSNSGFFAGIKEIGHGSATSFKAAGHGLISGSKAAGATIASGGGKVKDGLGAAGHKVMPGSKKIAAKAPNAKKKHDPQTFAIAPTQSSRPGSALDPNNPPLPGKPLGVVYDTLPHPAKVKVPTVGKAPGKKNIVARTFDKINPFGKHKPKNPDVAANNGVPH